MRAPEGSVISDDFEEDLSRLGRSYPKIYVRMERLMLECIHNPRGGIGKPEPLVGYAKAEVWSRRIVGKHRLVYEINNDSVVFLACYGHYGDH